MPWVPSWRFIPEPASNVILGVKRVSIDDTVSEQAEPPLAMELRDGVYLELGHVAA
jgi:hypothetical protein